MLKFQFPQKRPLKILFVGAHADDIEIGCGGTVQKLIEECETRITWIVLSGDEARREEARKSANYFLSDKSKHTYIVKDFRQSYFPYIGEKIKDYFETLKSIQPDLIFSPYLKDAHQDHRLTCELIWNTFRDHMILEYEIPKYEGDLTTPQMYVELDKEKAEKKVNAIMRFFTTQRGKPWYTQDMFWAHLRMRGVEANTRYAEGFHIRKIVL